MLTRRYMHEYGATRDHLANVALACRAHANRNPEAMMYDQTGRAWSRSPSNVTIEAMVLVLPEGSTRTRSPGCTEPAAIRPAKPRKSRNG